MSHKILVSDPISDEGIKSLLEHPDFDVDIQTDLTEETLVNIIPDYEGLIVRSQTQVTDQIIEAASNLKVIARAGVGVDNINIEAATLKGILVINAPDGNTISATEHSIAMILAMARNIPQAHQSLKAGEWNRKAFRGTELYKKTLGIIGAGRIGLGVAKRAQSFGMQILAFDPYLTEDKAKSLDIQLATVDEIASKSDFVTVHTPLTPKTKGIVGENFFKKAKPNLQIINVARGGIIDEDALINALDHAQISRAAIDVFEHEPPLDSPLIKHDKIIVTPHLGASTVEAQEKVAVSVSNEIIDILTKGTVEHAVNAPKMDMNEVDQNVKDYLSLATTIGEFGIQLLEGAPSEVTITYGGDVAKIDTSLISRTIVSNILKEDFGDEVNIINALALLNQQDVTYQIEKNKNESGFSNYIELSLSNDKDTIKIGGTVLSGFGPRIVRINNFSLDFKPNQYQIVTCHNDQPGIVGKTGNLLGDNGINIGSMTLGRTIEGGQALMILSIDQPASQTLVTELNNAIPFNKIISTKLTL
ncbi:phosphoglycerate dehydrogenase [Staphylococcus warneri]|uniref:D-3-phosphoglycerate dehydrogenase n=1 Tax=Staphylococcus warneri TaxID=1292 RepID=A0A2T4PZB8_STAWA|nr:phosphoglycerate dehydrogenase [Staphylococcus warneri]PTI14478.1 phosphoglycerate dehydrogenase [Staphylococcus warneri]PTI18892.1 phosphoglycerate dehydrogenase [Staphylococcus warneri]PTI23083.1 phosphoglycerate dehydrogenase [Staphylococcus warneri]PTI33756.1 phosphoglycerate dehydrogenase [Staphylococcus warneri]PTI50502.1 phosphoglycerate dehydrogenase [Staphylococcus warneri]